MRVRHDESELTCPLCGGSNIIRRGTVSRGWKAPPIGSKPVMIFAGIPRLQCGDCKRQPVLPVSFAAPRRQYTRSFERFVLSLRKSMTLKDLAEHAGTTEWTVREIEKRWLKQRYARPKLKHLETIAIDEIAVKKGHKYLTIVMDLASGAVVFVGKGKGSDALKPFWKRLKSSRAKVKAVAMDMSAAYFKAVSENLPGAAIVFDWFHVVKLLNDKLSQLRRELYREAKDKLRKDVLKGTRWLLLRRPEHLDKDRNEPQRLRVALQLNESPATAYYLKEELRLLWDEPNKRAAGKFLDDWLRRAEASGIRVLKTFATTIAASKSGLPAWFDYPISTGPLEGTNNKIKTLKRQAYGFRDEEYFELNIKALHHTRIKLIG